MNKKGGVIVSYKSKADRLREKVRQDLLIQLEQKGLDGEHYKNLIDDYIFMYLQKEKCQKDINENGVIIEYTNSYGKKSRKKNESCDMILKTNNQMIKILEFLKINPDENIDGSDNDEL